MEATNPSNVSFGMKFINKIKKYPQTVKYVISGTFAGLLSRVIASPFERVILLKQINQIDKYTNPKGFNSMFHIIKNITKKEGIKGVFKGNMVNFVKFTPLIAIEFYFYDKFKILLKNNRYNPLNESKSNMVAGGFAGLIAYTVVYPIDFTRTMVAINHIPRKVPFHQLMTYLYKKYGFLNFFKGLNVTLAGIFPFCALKFYFFELFSGYTKEYKQTKTLTMFENMILGSTASTLACAINFPLDVVRRRRQVQIIKNSTRNFTYWNMISFIFKKHGVLGFYYGMTSMFYKVGPAGAVMFMTNERIKEILEVNK